MIILCGCKSDESEEFVYYKSLVKELSEVGESSKDIPVNTQIIVEEIPNNFLRYTVIINRNGIIMKDIEAIIIHDKETNNVFPSIGIYEDKITLDESSKELGIKLTGYVEKYNKLDFKAMIKYKDEEGNNKKYYYIYNYRQ